MFRLAALLSLLAAPAFAQSADITAVVNGVRVVVSVAPVGGAGQPAAAPEARAADFAIGLMQDWSQPGAEGARRMARLYDDRVDFYGSRRGHAEVMADRHAFAARWPRRDYRIDPASIRVHCDTLCELRAEYDFAAADPASGSRSEGRSTLRLSLRPVGGGFVIAAEDGTVIARY